MAEFESRTSVNALPHELFEFLLRPANLQSMAPPESQFAFVQPPDVIELGSRLVCKVQAYGIVQHLSYEIVEFVSPERFRERMVEGPLKLWQQDYIVESGPEGSTLVNRIEFEPPAGMMGLIMNERRIIESLEDMDDYRSWALKKAFA